MMRQRKNVLRQKKDERKQKMIERKEKKKVEQKQNIGDECSSNWQTLPEDIMEKILQFADFACQRRLGQVNRCWRSIVFRTLMPIARCQLPWLVLPASPNYRINKYLSFLTFPENKLSKGKAVRLKLPKKLQGGWIYGSSKGWLIFVNEKELNSEICLLNPILGALHKLPPLRTIPSFNKFVKTREWEVLGIKGFCLRVKMTSTSDDSNSSTNFTVAAIFHDMMTLGLCRPGDEKWTVFNLPMLDYGDFLINDILFSQGTLYALVLSIQHDGGITPTHTLNFAFHDAEPLKLKLVFDKQGDFNDTVDEYHREYKIVSNATRMSMLFESTSKEVFLIHQMIDYVLKTKNEGDGGGHDLDIEGDEENMNANIEGNNIENEGAGGNGHNEEVVDHTTRHVRFRTRCFITYKIDSENNNYHMLQSLDNQLLFSGNDGAFTLPAFNIKGLGNDSIYFAMNMYQPEDWKWLPKTYISDEFGTFYLDSQRTERPLQGMEVSLKYQPCWFTPIL